MKPLVLSLTALALSTLPACSRAPEEHALFDALQPYCGKAFGGQVLADDTARDLYGGVPLVLHLRTCDGDTMSMPLHLGQVHGFSLRLTRTDDGLALYHRVRRRDGSAMPLDGYGGESGEGSTASRAVFPPGPQSLEIDIRQGGASFAGDTHILEWRAGEETLIYGFDTDPDDPAGEPDRIYELRMAFDLSTPITPPPPPWGETE